MHSLLTRLCRGLFARVLADLTEGRITLIDADGEHSFGVAAAADPLQATVHVFDPAFYPAALSQQSAGVGRAYMNGWWRCDDPVTLIRIFARNEAVLRRWTGRAAALLRPWHSFHLRNRRNTLGGARQNIAAHYDLGEDFFSLFLDPSLTYSCAIFADEERDLAAAQRHKLDRVCRQLDLATDDHVLEIGTGWGSFAVHAAKQYGCRVTTATLSVEQARYARERIEQEGLQDRIEVLVKDYRELSGQYDKLVSIEMIEAVGTQYYRTYFRRCAELLRDNGAMLLQAIVVHDRSYLHDSRHVDYVKRYIFPGGCLPSIASIVQNVAQASDLKIKRLVDITDHYVVTLHCWRERLLAARDRLKSLGLGEAFLRRWEFYFAYCEGGFRERRIGDVQVLLAKPRCGELPILPPPASPLPARG